MKNIEGLGLTKQRQTVLRVITESEDHLTANEVFDIARELLPGISFATVYNSLRFLKQEQLIGEVRFGADASRYERKLTHHHHALCRKCEKLVDVEISIPENLLEQAADRSNFKAESIELTLRGVCPKCSEKED